MPIDWALIAVAASQVAIVAIIAIAFHHRRRRRKRRPRRGALSIPRKDRLMPFRMYAAAYFWWVAHNAIAHPLLVLAPPVGRWLHRRTTEPLDEIDPDRVLFYELSEGQELEARAELDVLRQRIAAKAQEWETGDSDVASMLRNLTTKGTV